MIDAMFQYAFMRNALLAALMASITVGIIGTVAIEKKLVSMSGGMAQAAFGHCADDDPCFDRQNFLQIHRKGDLAVDDDKLPVLRCRPCGINKSSAVVRLRISKEAIEKHAGIAA